LLGKTALHELFKIAAREQDSITSSARAGSVGGRRKQKDRLAAVSPKSDQVF